MSFVLWNPAWETGIDSIDEQHRQMLAQIEGLLVAIHDHHPGERLPGLLAFLADYVETHFSNEENQMRGSNYPGLEGHRAIHDHMRAQVEHLLEGYRQKPEVMTEEVVDFLTDWLIGHINDHDLPMARHLLRFEAKASADAPKGLAAG